MNSSHNPQKTQSIQKRYQEPISLPAALDLLRSGEVVGIPTETVYGLAARIDSENALKKIFHTKERPFFDPLIVHVSSLEMVRPLIQSWPPIAEALSQKFWPGPLTFVLPKSSKVNPIITSGLETVGIRMPNHPISLELINSLGIPLAAPSANKFGKTSPTQAQHVLKEFHHHVPVLDGGPCQIGIESTILEIRNHQISLLRKGSILKSDIKTTLQQAGIPFEFVEKQENQITAPGQVKHHYMPSVPLILLDKNLSLESLIKKIQAELSQLPDQVEGVSINKPKGNIQGVVELQLPRMATESSRLLYSELRNCATKNADIIFFKIEPYHFSEAWAPLMDRLTRAASLRF